MCLFCKRRIIQPGLVLVIAIGLLTSIAGCGKKAPLSLPETQKITHSD
ncbi:hypothetical protein P8S54_02845 [Thiomicrospira sp. R3]|nr:hypothetical protein [Thiomicrospira sp. R3]WFE69251.1 hypothetical protein P8S54_02845 [Thiomicrospira sp. R3]